MITCVCGKKFLLSARATIKCKCGIDVGPLQCTIPTPFYIEERRSTCQQCPHYLPQEDGCGELKRRGKGYLLMGRYGIPLASAKCPLGYWGPTNITIRNLIYHICPIGDWRENVKRIPFSIFNGKRIVAIADIGEVQEAIDYVGSQVSKVIVLPNSKELREAATFLPLMLSVESTHCQEATFYGHTKGNSTADDPEGARLWREVMYTHLLDKWQECMKHLESYRFVGTHKMIWPANQRSPFPTKLKPTYPWMHCGTFWWFRNDAVFRRPDWAHYIINERYGVEAFPAQLYPHHECKSVWQPWEEHERAWPQRNPYDPGLYNTGGTKG